MNPIVTLLLGMAIVIGMIVVLRIGAFLSLITAAMVVSLLTAGDWATNVAGVATAFGETAGKIGIVIAAATIIGKCLMESGAAERIVRTILNWLGVKQGALALLSSGFLLSIPVFFDTVFYLLVPLARSMYQRTGVGYTRYLVAIAAGAVITHTLVPPTPGPLLMADIFGVDLATMMLAGLAVGIPCGLLGLAFAYWIDGKVEIPMRPMPGSDEIPEFEEHQLPSLFAAILPIILPVILIAGVAFGKPFFQPEGSTIEPVLAWKIFLIFGDKNVAMLLSAFVALAVYFKQHRPALSQLSLITENALKSGGVIILITSAGGAFGAMLRQAEVGDAVNALFVGQSASHVLLLMCIGYGLAFLLKIAQGSGTVAMITAAPMLAAMLPQADQLSIHPVYMAMSVGFGSLGISWMNDSGFWVFSQMGGLTEWETLRTWTVLLTLISVFGFSLTCLLATVYPAI
ncbi:MAG: gluconate permease [Planctomycetaceae bacterium]|nr:gluconate permease [Planctomycetaceae bacterium]